ncbi:MAG: NACHT domain-containing protein [Bacillota bacterium]|nr:NACHT domain-containing protein [Bacillota bacterium]
MGSIEENVVAQAIATLVDSFLKNFLSKCKKYLKDMSKELAVDFGNAYKKYLSNTRQRNAKVKTLLYRHEPKDIYSFYECIGLCLGRKIVDTSVVGNVLAYGSKLIITGTGGIGKSMLLKHLFLNCIETQDLVPVLIELRGLNNVDYKENSIIDFIYSSLCSHGFTLEKKYFLYSLEAGKYLFLLDGFDEVRNDLSQQVTQDIINVCNKYQENSYIISSRPQDQFIGWSDFCELKALPLSKQQALSLINKLEYDESIKSRFYHDLDDSLYKKHKSFASIPLLLTIMLITYTNSVTIPDNLNDFYEQAFTTLFHTHDATKGAYKRDIRSGLDYDDFKKIFSYFCFKSYFKSDYEFCESNLIDYICAAQKKISTKKSFEALSYIKDLTSSVCMLVFEGLKYRFSHRSFQEYFAALYTTQLSDEKQKRLLLPWIGKDMLHATERSAFLPMLADLQRERFSTNILLPMLEKLEELYKENDEDIINVFQKIYYKMNLEILKNEEFLSSLTIDGLYLPFHRIITITCRHFGYKESVIESKEKKEAAQKLFLVFNSSNINPECDFTLNEASGKGVYDEAILCFNGEIERISFALKCIEQCKCEIPNSKREFNEVLDEL